MATGSLHAMFGRLALAAAATVAVLVGACGGQDAVVATSTDTSTTAAGVPAASLPDAAETFDDPGEPVSVVVGESFALSVDVDPGTHSAWTLTTAPDPAVVVAHGHRFSADPDSEGATGSGGSDLWAFTATGAGDTSLTLSYGKPGAAPETTATFRIVVE